MVACCQPACQAGASAVDCLRTQPSGNTCGKSWFIHLRSLTSLFLILKKRSIWKLMATQARQFFLLGMVARRGLYVWGAWLFGLMLGVPAASRADPKTKGHGEPNKKEGPGSQAGRGGGISYLALAERSQPVRGPDNASVFVADCTCTRMLRFLRVFTVP